MSTTESTFEGVREVLVKVLGIEDRAEGIDESTPLFGNLPELDSLAVLELATSLEERFNFEIDDEEFTGEIFETVGSLVAFVNGKRG